MMINQRTKIIASILISIGVMILLLYFSNIKEIISLIGRINPLWIIFAVLVYNINWILRGYRWQLILDSMGHKIKLGDSIWLTILGNFTNIVTPARIGDTVKAFILKKRDSVALSKGLSSIFVDRISDFFGVVVLTYLSFMTISKDLILPGWINMLIIVSSSILIIGILILSVLSNTDIIGRMLGNIIGKMSSRIGIIGKLYSQCILPLCDNLKMVHKKNVLIRLGMSSIILWLFEVITTFILLYSLGNLRNIPIIIFAIMIASLTKTLPLTPGGIGVYEGTVAIILAAGGFSYTLGLTIGILDHGIKNIYTILLGVVSLSHNGIKMNNVTEFQNTNKLQCS